MKDKEVFISQQSERIQSMHDVLNELLMYQEVIKKAGIIIHGRNANGGNAVQHSVHEAMDRQGSDRIFVIEEEIKESR